MRGGPQKEYLGLAEYDPKAKLFHGRVLGINDVVTFEGRDPQQVAAAFVDSVDDYLAFCKERGKQPDQPFSGKFVLRVPSELHRQLSMVAEARDVSANTIAVEAIESRLAELLRNPKPLKGKKTLSH